MAQPYVYGPNEVILQKLARSRLNNPSIHIQSTHTHTRRHARARTRLRGDAERVAGPLVRPADHGDDDGLHSLAPPCVRLCVHTCARSSQGTGSVNKHGQSQEFTVYVYTRACVRTGSARDLQHQLPCPIPGDLHLREPQPPVEGGDPAHVYVYIYVHNSEKW